MILPSCAKLILVFLLAILHKVLRAAVIVIDKTDYIMKDINMLISTFKWYLLSRLYVKSLVFTCKDENKTQFYILLTLL